jgi:hypothetical protein
MGVQAWVGTVLRVAPIPDGQALETDRGRFTVDRHDEGKNVVPIDEAIAHGFMARGDGFLIEPTTRDHPLSHDLYSDLDKGLDLDHLLKAVELDHPLQDHDRER